MRQLNRCGGAFLPVLLLGALAGAHAPVCGQAVPATEATAIPLPMPDRPGFQPPPFQLQREEEDYSYLRDPALRTEPLDAIKYIPLGNREGWYASIGGETRQFTERFQNENWGLAPAETNAYLLQRYMLHSDFHFGDGVRIFTQLKSGVSSFREGGPRPVVDQDRLDFNQAFVDLNFGTKPGQRNPALTIRGGRQEMQFGVGRMVSVREGPNVRAGFDGLRAIVHSGQWRVDTFAVRPAETNPGFFDDATDPQQTFWGVYSTGPAPRVPALAGLNLDLYYLGIDRKLAFFDQGIGPETRHSVGARLSSTRGPSPWEYDFEALYQLGRFGAANIRAWTLSSDTAYMFRNVRFQPRIGLNTGIASGDKDPTDNTLGTFFAPFPNGHYFGVISHNGPLNVQGLRPNVTFHLPHRIMVTPDIFFFWRHSVRDALYAIPGFPMRSGQQSDARYIGTQPQVTVLWPMNRHLLSAVTFARFQAGPFLRETPPGRNLTHMAAFISYRF